MHCFKPLEESHFKSACLRPDTTTIDRVWPLTSVRTELGYLCIKSCPYSADAELTLDLMFYISKHFLDSAFCRQLIFYFIMLYCFILLYYLLTPLSFVSKLKCLVEGPKKKRLTYCSPQLKE